ncbi:hypothetical protein [uncultured Sphingomonas sp.]|uniref:hypothetical protein n=1 Tax=uncultured Sphingomonas sp. TaxID=158754 RepID=UPI0035CAF50B
MDEPLRIDLDQIADGEGLASLGEALKSAMDDEGKGWMLLSKKWLGGKAADAITEALADFDLLDAIAGAWAGVEEIASRGDPAKYPQKRASRLRLGKHVVEIDLKPQMEIAVGGWTSAPIALTIPLTATIEAVELRIKQGFITAIGGGICDLGIEIKRGDAVLVDKRSLKKFDLPGDHRFKPPGIDIRPQQFRHLAGQASTYGPV